MAAAIPLKDVSPAPVIACNDVIGDVTNDVTPLNVPSIVVEEVKDDAPISEVKAVSLLSTKLNSVQNGGSSCEFT